MANTHPASEFIRTVIGASSAAHGANERSSISARMLAALLRLELPADSALDKVSFPTRQVQEGDALVRAGEECRTLYVVRCGSFKTLFLDPCGAEQGLGFPMAGDTIGIDGLASGRYTSEAYALERSEVVAISCARVAELSQDHPFFATLLYRLIGREVSAKQAIMFALGSLGAEARLATFLLDLSERFGRMGYSRSRFNLRMTRNEIASYLGLKIETVSRAFSAFAAAGVLHVNNREIEIVDAEALRRSLSTVGHEAARTPRASQKRQPAATIPARRPDFALVHQACAA